VFVAYPVTDQLRTPESQTDIRDIPRRIACTKRAKKLTRFGALAPSAGFIFGRCQEMVWQAKPNGDFK